MHRVYAAQHALQNDGMDIEARAFESRLIRPKQNAAYEASITDKAVIECEHFLPQLNKLIDRSLGSTL